MNFIKKSTTLFMISLLTISLHITSCRDNAWDNHISNDQQLTSDFMEIIESQAELSTFAGLLKTTGYDELLKSSTIFTVFAPTNSAWTNVNTQDVESLRKIISTLIVYNAYYTVNSTTEDSFKAVNGKSIFYDATTQTFNGAKIIKADIRSANGVVQITDKIVERKENIWDYLSAKTNNLQYQYIKSLDAQIMDLDKSIAIGVYPDGKTKYDTAWKHVNKFLDKYSLQDEDSLYTYVIVENAGFTMLYNKYLKYFTLGSSIQTDSLTRYNVCQDFVFRGVVDITTIDTLTNIDGVKVPFTGASITETYNASNGRVYVINQSNILLRNKIKPVKIEGENYSNSYNSSYIFTRYKRWASGERDIALSCGETQTDSVWNPRTMKRDSLRSYTYFVNGSYVVNTNNFYIEFKAKVNSAAYDIYYVAYDDITSHYDTSHVAGTFNLIQKLFISMPGAQKLKYGAIETNNHGVINNCYGPTQCFVGQGFAGVHELTKLKKWNLIPTSQLIDAPLTALGSDVLAVTRTGELTMWLCNTALSATSSRQGLLFLDYILLVPRITEE